MPKFCTIQSNFQNQFKVSIVGCGNVGATAAYAMLIDGTPTELVLIDHSKERAEGLLLDFEHTLSFLPYTKITGTDDYSACANSHIIFGNQSPQQEHGTMTTKN